MSDVKITDSSFLHNRKQSGQTKNQQLHGYTLVLFTSVAIVNWTMKHVPEHFGWIMKHEHSSVLACNICTWLVIHEFCESSPGLDIGPVISCT